MKNNKGFTLVEVAVSFTLVATISIVLLQLVLSLKEVYLSGDVKTTLLSKQGIMSKNIYDDLNKKTLSSVTTCGLSCITFTYTDSTEKNLLIDPGNKTIKYGDYTMQLDKSSTFGLLSAYKDETATALSSGDDSILTIKIPIYTKLLENENFGFNLITTYNRAQTTVNLSSELNSTNVTLSGINSKLYAIDDGSSKVKGLFIKVFRQKQGEYFSNDHKNFIKSNNANKFSILTSLHALKATKIKQTIINDVKASSLSNSEKRQIIQAYQNGYYSLLLNYDDAALSSGSYQWWYQPNNIANKEPLTTVIYSGFKNGQGSCNTCGITYNKTGDYWANIKDYNTNLGVKSGNIINFNGENATYVDLYAEAREYICKYTLTDVTYKGTNIKELILSDGTKMCDE